MDVKIRSFDEIPVVAVRHVGDYAQLGGCFEKIIGWAASKGMLGPDVKCLGIFHDNPRETPLEELRSAACITVGSEVGDDVEAGVERVAIEGGDYAVATFEGPYHDLGSAYDGLLGHWLPQSGRELAPRPCFEIYLNSPTDTAPEHLLTEIHVPLV